MPLTTPEENAVANLALYNGNLYNASTNPKGMAGAGYQVNAEDAWNDTATATNAVARLAGEVAADEATATAAVATVVAARDATIAAAAGAGVTDGDKGDIVVSSAGTVWTIDNNAVTAGKISSNAVTTAKINDGAITTAKINDDAVTAAKIENNLSGGFSATSYNNGTITTGTLTPDAINGNLQYYINGGAHTLAPPSTDTAITIQVTNNGSAGTITTSGFTIVVGDTLTTTNGHDFLLHLMRINGFSRLSIEALQ